MTRRFAWPWGRISPKKRLEEIDRMMLRHEASIRILEAQTREAIRLHKKNIEALQGQRKIVESFIQEDVRKGMMEEAFELESRGIPVLESISTATSIQKIEEILEEARQQSVPKNLDPSLEVPSSQASPDDLDLFEDMDVQIDDIFGQKE